MSIVKIQHIKLQIKSQSNKTFITKDILRRKKGDKGFNIIVEWTKNL